MGKKNDLFWSYILGMASSFEFCKAQTSAEQSVLCSCQCPLVVDLKSPRTACGMADCGGVRVLALGADYAEHCEDVRTKLNRQSGLTVEIWNLAREDCPSVATLKQYK
jgi:hypothetical protein